MGDQMPLKKLILFRPTGHYSREGVNHNTTFRRYDVDIMLCGGVFIGVVLFPPHLVICKLSRFSYYSHHFYGTFKYMTAF